VGPDPHLSESIEIRTADGVSLAANVLDPLDGQRMRGTIVMAHAMFARQSAYRWLAEMFRERGWRAVTFDFRGHGKSPSATYGYDDFVAADLPAVIECARERGEGKPVSLVGHSLGGHVALAAQGCGLVKLDSIVLVASNVWLRDFEPNGSVWAVKRAILEGFLRTAKRLGRFPARALRMGSDDESVAYVEDLARFGLEGRWGSRDRTRDYRASLGEVTIPVYSIASTGDRINARPVCVERMLSRCRGPLHLECVSASDDGSRAPGHGALLTSQRARSAFDRAEGFLRTVAGPS
jgi:predicted alpha/beta hydrolase